MHIQLVILLNNPQKGDQTETVYDSLFVSFDFIIWPGLVLDRFNENQP